MIARSIVSFGMFWSIALSIARRSRGLADASPPPSRAATVISRISRVKTLPRFASAAAFLCLMFAHLLWPAMRNPSHEMCCTDRGLCRVRLYEALPLEKLVERRQPHVRVVDFEHPLLDRERQRQQLGEPVADPRSVVVSGPRGNSAGRAWRRSRSRIRASGAYVSGSGCDGSSAIVVTSPMTSPVASTRAAAHLEARDALASARAGCRAAACRSW